MTAFLAILCVILIGIVVVQIGRVTELAAKIRGEEEMQDLANKRHANMMLAFVVLFLIGTFVSAYHYKNYMLGYGPHESASAHGGVLDGMFNVTLFFTGIVFVLTHIALFYFAWKYRADKGRKADFISHDNKLEMIWTLIPAVVMTYLVVGGLDAWNEVMADVPKDAVSTLTPQNDNEFLEIEATGWQFGWTIRYPGKDGKVGTKNFRLINNSNPLGQDWKDEKNLDDMHVGEIVLPKDRLVRVRVTSKDVLHNFNLPHFRNKIDAVPGMPTYIVFKPTKSTEEYRQTLKDYKEYQRPDPNDPTKMLWETFNYELACAELCGTGHYSMKMLVRVVDDAEYRGWLEKQQSYYLSSIRFKADDPFKDQLFDFEVKARKAEFDDALGKALAAEEAAAKTIRFTYVNFETGSAALAALSNYELDNLADAMNRYPNLRIEVAGHTDNTGDPDANLALSEQRAQTVFDYLVNAGVAADRMTRKGYGQTVPVDTNDTEAGRAKNRRTEFVILNQ